MSDNQANPTKGAETDLQKAAKSVIIILIYLIFSNYANAKSIQLSR